MKVKKFLVVPKQGLTRDAKQALQFPNGVVIVGYDAWRRLNKKDFPSYPTEIFHNIFQMERYYKTTSMGKMKAFYLSKPIMAEGGLANGLY